MNILLINPKFNSWTLNVYVPLGLAYIASALLLDGNKVEIIDFNLCDYDKRDFHKALYKAQVVGLTGMVTEYDRVVSLANEVKNHTHAPLILGGPLASSLGGKMMADTGADYLVLNEGEKTTVELVRALKSPFYSATLEALPRIQGIIYRDNGRCLMNDPGGYIENIDDIAFPARHLLKMDLYVHDYMQYVGLKLSGFGKLRGTNMFSSRGCPFQCVFCSRLPWGRKWRPRSAQNLVTEMKNLNALYGINEFLYCDDNFVLDKKRVMDFCTILNKERMNAVWSCNARVDLVDKEMLDAMYAAGCRNIGYGIESGNQDILKRMKKGTTLDQARQAIKATKAAGINSSGYYLIGMKGETKETINDTLNFAKSLNMDFYGFSFVSPLPASELYDELGLSDEITKYKEYSTFPNYNLTADCSDAYLGKLSGRIFKEFYLERKFGRYYYLSPRLWVKGVQTILNLLRRGQMAQFKEKIKAIFAKARV